MNLPLLEDDLRDSAIIEPGEVIDPIDMPTCLVLCFFKEVVDSLAERSDARRVETLAAAHARGTRLTRWR